MKSQRQKDALIAAAVTFAVALGLLLWLFFGGMTYDKAILASVSTAEIQTPEEEELFLEPDIVSDQGEPDAESVDAPAPMMKGEPEFSEIENTKLTVPGKNEKAAPPVEQKITQNKQQEVKATEPPKTDENKQKVTSKMAGKFAGDNGTPSGALGSQGAGGTGIGIAGNVNGRTFLGCPKPSVALKSKVVVQVTVTINSSGKVVKATARSKQGNVSADILEACRKAAMQARWNEDAGTPSASGTLTFTITPR